MISPKNLYLLFFTTNIDCFHLIHNKSILYHAIRPKMLHLLQSKCLSLDACLRLLCCLQVSQKLSSELCINLMDDTLLSVAARRPPVPSSSVPPLFIITPTYRRPEQIPELTRLAQTLMHIPNIHWLVIEDSVNKTSLVTQLLFRTGIPFEHLVGKLFLIKTHKVHWTCYNS